MPQSSLEARQPLSISRASHQRARRALRTSNGRKHGATTGRHAPLLRVVTGVQEQRRRIGEEIYCAILSAMIRSLRYLLLAFAVLFAQHAGQWHALYHAGLELAGGHSHPAGHAMGETALGDDQHEIHHEEHPGPVADHGVDRCLAFQAIGNALTCNTTAVAAAHIAPPAPLPVSLPIARMPRIEFDSRAPPRLFS